MSVNILSTRTFLFTALMTETYKKVRALGFIADALQTGNGMISWQVIQEFLNVSTRKFLVPLKPEDAKIYLQKVLHPLCHVFPDLDMYARAVDIFGKTDIHFTIR